MVTSVRWVSNGSIYLFNRMAKQSIYSIKSSIEYSWYRCEVQFIMWNSAATKNLLLFSTTWEECRVMRYTSCRREYLTSPTHSNDKYSGAQNNDEARQISDLNQVFFRRSLNHLTCVMSYIFCQFFTQLDVGLWFAE